MYLNIELIFELLLIIKNKFLYFHFQMPRRRKGARRVRVLVGTPRTPLGLETTAVSFAFQGGGEGSSSKIGDHPIRIDM
jgi:hypothetical protein